MPVLEFGLIVAMTISLVLNIATQVFTDGMVKMRFFLFVRLFVIHVVLGEVQALVLILLAETATMHDEGSSVVVKGTFRQHDPD